MGGKRGRAPSFWHLISIDILQCIGIVFHVMKNLRLHDVGILE